MEQYTPMKKPKPEIAKIFDSTELFPYLERTPRGEKIVRNFLDCMTPSNGYLYPIDIAYIDEDEDNPFVNLIFEEFPEMEEESFYIHIWW